MGIALHFLRTALSIIRIIFHFKEHLYSAVFYKRVRLVQSTAVRHIFFFNFLRITRFSKNNNRPPHAPKLYDETFQTEV